MSIPNENPGVHDEDTTAANQPLTGRDTTIEPDPTQDPAQAEWDHTQLLDEGDPEAVDPSPTATGDDPDLIPDGTDQIPAEDLPGSNPQPDTQGDDAIVAELGEEGEGDLGPADL